MRASHLFRNLSRRLAFGGMIAVACAWTARADLVDGIAAVVNEDIITFTDIKNFSGSTEEMLRKTYSVTDPTLNEKLRDARKAALDELIERRLIIQQFNSRGGKVPDSLVEDEIRTLIDEQYGRDRSVFIKTLEALGRNLESFKDQIRDTIIVRYMRQTEVTKEVIISPFKIEQYYNEHPGEFHEGEKVQLRLLYIKKGETAEEIEGGRNLSQEILLKLSTGSDFSSIARVYSEGPEKNDGGELGYVGKDTLREELRDAAFSLKPGQLSKVIETHDGFYILQVEEKKPSRTTTIQEARDLIERSLIQKEREAIQKRWVKSLRRKAYIRLY